MINKLLDRYINRKVEEQLAIEELRKAKAEARAAYSNRVAPKRTPSTGLSASTAASTASHLNSVDWKLRFPRYPKESTNSVRMNELAEQITTVEQLLEKFRAAVEEHDPLRIKELRDKLECYREVVIGVSEKITNALDYADAHLLAEISDTGKTAEIESAVQDILSGKHEGRTQLDEKIREAGPFVSLMNLIK